FSLGARSRRRTMIEEHATEFAGKAVRDWEPGKGIADPARFHYRLSVEWEEEQPWLDKLAAFLTDPQATAATGLISGNWGYVLKGDEAANVVNALVSARDRLPNLTALFLGDITREEGEISWIVQADVSPLFRAYPRLEHFRVRGGTDLRLGALQHDRLTSLVV